MFYYFYTIIIFLLNREKDDKRSAYVYFNFFHVTVNSHNLETNVILLFYSAMKTHLHVDQSECTYYPNYFYKLKCKNTNNDTTSPLFMFAS